MPQISSTRLIAKPLLTGSALEPLPRLIGIAGPSCAGKTTLAQALLTQLPEPASFLSLDAYYRDCAKLSSVEKAVFNFDAPEALDHELLRSDLRRLASGHNIEMPTYDFVSHTRKSEQIHVEARPFILIEGLFALYWSEINPLYHLRIFIAASDTLCFKRRLARDTSERGRSPDLIRSQYQSQVRPMFHRYIQPTVRSADLLVDGSAPLTTQIDTIVEKLN